MNFLTRQETAERFAGKTVAIVGSGPGVLDNEIGFIDSHDIVVRVNNYKIFPQTGGKVDVYYSFFGSSVHIGRDALVKAGCTLCMCKLPNGAPLKSAWHVGARSVGVDFRYVYKNRSAFWFCDTYVPDAESYLEKFYLIGGRHPTTGFCAILDVSSFDTKSVYLTGFDFFSSRIHNVTDSWVPKNPDDPFGHRPELELKWLAENKDRFLLDPTLTAMVANVG
jgi:hypothetical protein